MRKLSRRRTRAPFFILLAVLALLPTLAQAGESAPPDLDSAGTGPDAPATGGGDEGASLDPHG